MWAAGMRARKQFMSAAHFLSGLREDICPAQGYNASLDPCGLDDFSSLYFHSLERVTSLEGHQ